MPVKIYTKDPSPLLFIELEEFEVVMESPAAELERRVCARFMRRQVQEDPTPLAQAALDEMLQRGETDPIYSKGTVQAGWWVELPYPFGRQWVPFADRHRDIEIQLGPPLRTWRDKYDGRVRRSGQPPVRLKTRDLIDFCHLHIEVQLDEMIVEWFRTPRETRVKVKR